MSGFCFAWWASLLPLEALLNMLPLLPVLGRVCGVLRKYWTYNSKQQSNSPRSSFGCGNFLPWLLLRPLRPSPCVEKKKKKKKSCSFLKVHGPELSQCPRARGRGDFVHNDPSVEKEDILGYFPSLHLPLQSFLGRYYRRYYRQGHRHLFLLIG